MSVAYVKEIADGGDNTNATGFNVTLTATPSVGNTLVAAIKTSGSVVSLVSSSGNLWTIDVSETVGVGAVLTVARLLVTDANLSTVSAGALISVQKASADGFSSLLVSEFSGIDPDDPVDVISSDSWPPPGVTTHTTAGVTPTVADCIFVACTADGNFPAGVSAGWTDLPANVSPRYERMAYKIPGGMTASGDITWTYGNTSGYGASAIIAYKPAGADPEQHTGEADLSGEGTLAGDGSPSLEADVALSGEGTLAGDGTPSVTAFSSFSGEGALSGEGYAVIAAQVLLSGSGVLDGIGSPAISADASLSGEGTLEGEGSPAVAGSVDLSGEGTLSGSSGGVSASVSLSGEGTLSGEGFAVVAASADFSGEGTLSGSGSVLVFASVALSGSGALSGVAVPSIAADILLSGEGTLSVSSESGDGIAHFVPEPLVSPRNTGSVGPRDTGTVSPR